MNRITIFAHYDRDAIVDEYVLYYLRGLEEVSARILFVSDTALARSETDKLEGLAELVSAAPHGEYDFGSWKRGIAYLGSALSQIDELIDVSAVFFVQTTGGGQLRECFIPTPDPLQRDCPQIQER